MSQVEIDEIYFPKLFVDMGKITIKNPFKERNNILLEIEKKEDENKVNYFMRVYNKSDFIRQSFTKIGLFPVKGEKDLKKKISDFLYSEKFQGFLEDIVSYGHRALFIALDSNAIINNIKFNVFSDVSQEIQNRLFFLLSRASSHEFFFKANMIIKEEQNTRILDLFRRNPFYSKLFPSSWNWQKYHRLNHWKTLNRDGRKGVAGLIKYYEISKENTVITKSHSHPYYHEPLLRRLQAENAIIGIDSVYDTLIMSEFEQFIAVTNSHVIFLTGDRNLAGMAKILGIDTFLVEFEYEMDALEKEIEITEKKIGRLISELLVEYDALEVVIEHVNGPKRTYLLSFADKSLHSRGFQPYAYLYSMKQRKLYRIKLQFGDY